MNLDITSEKYKGLTTNQAKEKLRTEGYNKLLSSKPKNLFSIALGVVKDALEPKEKIKRPNPLINV